MKTIHSPYFSVIVCLYNSEKFFQRGFRCLSSQSFKDYEVILVDDGSGDATSYLCDEVAEFFPYVTVLHQDNQGLGYARNSGIDAAKGKYLCFFDIDDNVGNDWLEYIYDEIKDINPDLLVYGYNEINIKFHNENSFQFERKLLTDKSHFTKEFSKTLSGIKFNNGFAWNKVYKKKFLDTNNLRFTNVTIQQDEIFNHMVYKCFPVTLISEKILYNYYIYNKENNRNRYIPNRIGNFEHVKYSFIEIKNNFEIEDKILDDYIHRRYITNVLFNRNPISPFENRKDFYQKIITNNEVINSIVFLRKNKSRGRNINDFIFNLYCLGIRKKSPFILLITDCLNTGIRIISGLILKFRN